MISKFVDELRGKAAIMGAAEKNGEDFETVRAEIQRALDEAWEKENETLRSLFPNGKPTPERLVGLMARLAKNMHL